jgi:hypothetical protein
LPSLCRRNGPRGAGSDPKLVSGCREDAADKKFAEENGLGFLFFLNYNSVEKSPFAAVKYYLFQILVEGVAISD